MKINFLACAIIVIASNQVEAQVDFDDRIGCGIRNTPLIRIPSYSYEIYEAEYAEFPWMVAILKQEKINKEFSTAYQCGGSIIHPQVVLTVGHCVYKNFPHELIARAGEWDTLTKEEIYMEQDRQVTEIVLHEQFSNESFHNNDVALLFIAQEYILSFHVNTVCLPPINAQFDNERCYVTGWGGRHSGERSKLEEILKKIDVSAVPYDKCQEQLRDSHLGKYYQLHESFICADGEISKYICQGDSGDPLNCPIPGEKDKFYQAGIVAWSLNCNGTHPGVYASVSYFRNWIDNVIASKGLSAELYYVRDGQINEYAMHFVVPIAAQISEISFTWQSLAGRPLPYQINVMSSDPEVLPRPTLNITRMGDIPTSVQTFAIGMKCSGLKASEVHLTISIEVILNRALNNITEITLKRKKICLLNSDIEDNNINDPLLLETVIPPQSGFITFIIGGVLALVLVALLLLIAYCARGPVKSGIPINTNHLMKTSSFQHIHHHIQQIPPPTQSLQLPINIPQSTVTSIYLSPSTCDPTYATLPRYNNTHNSGYQSEPEQFHRRISEVTVQRCRVRLSNLIQEGQYGRVYKGTYNNNQEVLVKTVSQRASQIQVSLLLQEGMSLYGAQHSGILSVLGVSIEDHATPYVLYPAPNNTRNLKLFLMDNISGNTIPRGITTIQIVLMANQLAMALGHLHRHGVIHKDVATRNCVIDDQLCVKLADNSLSKDLFPGDYHCLGDNENRPIKWLALETIQQKHFSEASDTWAFGVLMWELCTFAKQPYAEVDAFEMELYLRDGYRLAQPYNCPDELFTIMAYCWALSPIERPNFIQLQSCLSDFYSQLTKYV